MCLQLLELRQEKLDEEGGALCGCGAWSDYARVGRPRADGQQRIWGQPGACLTRGHHDGCENVAVTVGHLAQPVLIECSQSDVLVLSGQGDRGL